MDKSEIYKSHYDSSCLIPSKRKYIQYKDHEIIVDHLTGFGMSTVFRVIIENKDGFKINIQRLEAFSKILNKIGIGFISLGDSKFDSRYSLTTNNKDKLNLLLKNEKFRNALINSYDENNKSETILSLKLTDYKRGTFTNLKPGQGEIEVCGSSHITDEGTIEHFCGVIMGLLDALGELD